MAIKSDKKYRFYPSPTGGLRLDVPAEMLEKNMIPDVQNMYIRQGMMATRFGYSTYCSSLPGSSRVTQITHYDSEVAGKKIEIANCSAGHLYYVSGVLINSCALTGFTLASANANLLSGDVWCQMENHTELGTALQSWLLLNYSILKETDKDHYCPLIYQSGAGNPIQFLLAGSSYDYMSTHTTPLYLTHRAKVMTSYAGFCVLLATWEEANFHPQRVRWSTAGHVTKGYWPDANRNELADTKGTIINASVLNNTLIIYKEDAIIGMTYIGGDYDFRFDMHIPDEGLMAPRLLKSVGNSHFFVGTQNIYQYFGGVNLEPIGDPIWDTFLDDLSDGAANAVTPYRNRAVMSYIRDRGLIVIAIPTATPFWPTKCYVYQIKTKSWTIWSLAHNITAEGEFEHDTGHGSVYLSLFGNSTGNMFCWLEDGETDAGTAITHYFLTKVIFPEELGLGKEAEWDLLEFDAKGSGTTDTITIQVRLDYDTAWTTVGSVTLTGGTNMTHYQLDFNYAARRIQFRFYNSTSGNRIYISHYQIREREIP